MSIIFLTIFLFYMKCFAVLILCSHGLNVCVCHLCFCDCSRQASVAGHALVIQAFHSADCQGLGASADNLQELLHMLGVAALSLALAPRFVCSCFNCPC